MSQGTNTLCAKARLLLLLFTTVMTACGGGDSDISIPIVRAAQEKSDWCWAAAEQMVLAARGTKCDQSTIVSATKRAVLNVEAEPDEIEASLAGLSAGALATSSSFWAEKPTRSEVMSQLSKGHPLIVQYLMEFPHQGHFVVLYGYSATGKYLMLDPDRLAPAQGHLEVGVDDWTYVSPGNGRTLYWSKTIFVDYVSQVVPDTAYASTGAEAGVGNPFEPGASMVVPAVCPKTLL